MCRFINILLLFCASTLVDAQNIVFADANFKAKLLMAHPSNYIAGTGLITAINYVTIDTNHDGEIQVSEAQNIIYLNVGNSNITNLAGIEYFTNLNRLNYSDNNIPVLSANGLSNLEIIGCSGCNITSLSFLSNFPNLKTLFCNRNPFTDINFNGFNVNYLYCEFSNLNSINLSSLPNLIALGLSGNNITALDFSNNPQLQSIRCDSNLITTLDFRNNPLLNDLGCAYNPNLSSIYIKNGVMHFFGSNPPFVSQNDDWSNCPNLNYICADANEITTIQNVLAPNYNMANITIDSACALGTEGFESESFSIYPNPSKGIFNLKFNAEKFATTKIQVYNHLGQLVYENTTQIVDEFAVDLSYLPQGQYFLKVLNGEEVYNHKIIKE